MAAVVVTAFVWVAVVVVVGVLSLGVYCVVRVVVVVVMMMVVVVVVRVVGNKRATTTTINTTINTNTPKYHRQASE